MNNLRLEARFLRAEIDALLRRYPELSEDDELRLEVFEAETDFHKLIDRLVQRKLEARELATGAKLRKQEVGERQSRFERQEAGFDTLIKSLMQFANMQKVVLPEATVSITKPRTTVEIIDVDQLPQGFVRIERTPLKTEIKKALEAGEEIPGATLSLSNDGLLVRTK